MPTHKQNTEIADGALTILQTMRSRIDDPKNDPTDAARIEGEFYKAANLIDEPTDIAKMEPHVALAYRCLHHTARDYPLDRPLWNPEEWEGFIGKAGDRMTFTAALSLIDNAIWLARREGGLS